MKMMMKIMKVTIYRDNDKVHQKSPVLHQTKKLSFFYLYAHNIQLNDHFFEHMELNKQVSLCVIYC